MSSMPLPVVMADGPLAPAIEKQAAGLIQWVAWQADPPADRPEVLALYTYGHPVVDGKLLNRFPKLQVISNYGVGVDHIRLEAARERHIPVGNTPGILDGATADQGFALLLAAARRIVEGDRYARSPQFTVYDPGYMLGREVHGSTLGIIGLGRIGRQVAQRARGFDMRVLYHNRHHNLEAEKAVGAIYHPLAELLKQSDYVMLTCPLTHETRGLIGEKELGMMKPTTILINIARGPVVDTAALTKALQAGTIAGAGLDVTDPEPLPRDHPLLQLNNVTVVPHLGSATVQTRQKMAEMSIENLLAGLAGRPLPYQVK